MRQCALGRAVCDCTLYVSFAAQALEDAGPAADGSRAWSCLIFVSRKLAALALDALLAATPGLGFLRAAPFMGHGGPLLAASMNLDVRLLRRTLMRCYFSSIERHSWLRISL